MADSLEVNPGPFSWNQNQMSVDRIQVDSEHYQFASYMTKARWASVWHQIDEISRLRPESVLEVGPGPGVFKSCASLFNVPITTLDLDPDLKPDFVGSATGLPFDDDAFDVVCSFQMLEHLPYDVSLVAFSEMARTARRAVVISLPDVKPQWRYCVHIPKLGVQDFLVSRPCFSPVQHRFDGEHHWEINKQGYELARVKQDFSRYCRLVKDYRVADNLYHHFFVFEK